MKLDPKVVTKLAGTLLGISLVVSALLGGVNLLTAEKIAAINAANTAAAMDAVVSVEGATYEPLEVTDELKTAAASYAKLDSLYEVYDGSNLVGYTVKVIASGSQGDIEMMVGTDTNLAVTGVAIVDNSETSGIGSKVMGNVNGVLDQFVGMSGAGSLAVGKTVDGISGATVSSKGVTTGVNAALAAVEALA